MGLLRMPSVKVPAGSPPVSDAQESFVGGENKKAASSIAPLDQVAAMTNVRVIREGELAKRPGLRRVMATATGFLPGMRLYPSTLNLNRVLGVDTAKHVRYCTLSGSAATKVDIADLATAFQPGLNCAEFRDGSGDVVYIGTASGGMLKWDGATTITEGVASGIVTGIGTVWVYNQRLFAVKGVGLYSGITGYTSFPTPTQTLYWSGLNNGDTLGDTSNGGGSATIRSFGGSVMMGGFALGSKNFILHRNAVSVFNGVTFDDINITAGTEGVAPTFGVPYAWKVIDQAGYILTSEGVFIASEGGVRSAASPGFPDPVKAYLLVNGVSLGKPWLVLDNARRNEVWFILTGASSVAFIWNTILGRFTGSCAFGFVIQSACSGFDTSHQSALYFIDTSGDVYSTDFADPANQVYQDAAVSYTSSVQLRRMYSQEAPQDQKSYRWAQITMGAGAGETPAANGSTTGAKLSYTNSAGTVADTTDLKAQQVNWISLSGQGPHIDLTITDNGASSTGWSVVRAGMQGASLGQRGG